MKLYKAWFVILIIAGTFTIPLYAQEAPHQACENLTTTVDLEAATIIAATPVGTGKFIPPNSEQPLVKLPTFCRVQLSITPTPDSDIRAEIWLPLNEWNGNFLTVGNGAWGGSIQYQALADNLTRNYAVASSNTGHNSVDASFAIGHPEKLIDFGYRAVHLTAVLGKAVIVGLYNTPPRYSYFNGCSGGGRQSFMEAQRYPKDFNGIIAGAPGYDRTDVAFQTLGMIQATHATPESFIPPAKHRLIHDAAMSVCDAKDGLIDGLISDPVNCDFDPRDLQCRAYDAATCLTEPQVIAAHTIYATITDPRTGELITAGLEPGSELHWAGVAGEEPNFMYLSLFQHIVFPDEDWDFRSMDLESQLDAARAADNGVLAAISPNLDPFFKQGGKLLIYHGWADQNIPPLGSVDYYQQVVETLGLEKTNENLRLYMVPGMGHCGGGHGPNEFDMLDALDKWQDEGQAPQAIIAKLRKNGNLVRSRPICPYPQISQYDGTGSIDEASNFSCVMPAKHNPHD